MKGWHIAVTGASAGIGRAIAEEMARIEGARVTLVARRRPLLESLAEALPCPAHVAVADLADVEASCAWIDEAEAAHGPIDLLVNNAGMQFVDHALAIDDAASERLLALNLLTPIRLCHRLGTEMSARGRGALVNVASMAGVTWTPSMAHYCASKAGLAYYSEVLHLDLKPAGVHVVTVYPGPVSSDLETAARERLQSSFIADNAPTGSPEALARLIRAAIERRRRRVYYPRMYGLAYGWRRLAQWLTEKFTPPLR